MFFCVVSVKTKDFFLGRDAEFLVELRGSEFLN